MAQTKEKLEQQIYILEKKRDSIPANIHGKYPPNYYALDGMIKSKKNQLQQLKTAEWLAQ